MPRSFDQAGFTLLETLIAATLLATAITSLAYLVALASAQASNNRHALMALVAAQSKLEQLRAGIWTYAPDGTRLSDLMVSPAGSLVVDTPGFVDYPPVGGDRFVRRWALSPLAPSDQDTLILQVCVYRRPAGRGMQRPEACVATARTRKP